MTGETDRKENNQGLDNHGFSHESNVQSARSKDVLKDKLSVQSIQEKKVSLSPSGKSQNVRGKEDDADKVDLSCGIWKLRTKVFGTKFSNLYVFSLFVGLSTFFTMMVQSVLHIQLTSIERQFNIDNARAGLFDTAARVGSMCTILFAGHFAKRVHIPVVVGVSGIIQGTALMVPAFIQLADPYTLPIVTEATFNNASNTSTGGDNAKYLCETNFTGSSRRTNSTTGEVNQLAFAVIVMVQAVKGITDAFHSGFLPTLYLDDNMLDKTKMGIFFGINGILSELAQPVGKQINAILTEIPVDLKHTKMDTKDSRFVAAWWLAFLIYGIGTVLFSIPVMLFPRKLVTRRQQEEALERAAVSFAAGDLGLVKPETEEPESKDSDRKLSAASTGDNHVRTASQYGKRKLTPVNSHASGVSETLARIARRRSSLLPPIEGPKERRISFDGSMIFEQPIKPKQADEKVKRKNSTAFIELVRDFPRAFIRVFRRPVFYLILLDIAIISIPMAGTSIFRSVYINKEYNVSMSEVATLTGLTAAAGQIIGTLISGWLANRVKSKLGYIWIMMGTHVASMCITPMYIIFGCGNQPIYGHEGDFGVKLNMTDDCSCRGTKSLLSCGEDGNNYLSPCYAGCKTALGNIFRDCSPLHPYNSSDTMSVTPGLCDVDCYSNFLVYVILHAVQSALFSMGMIPRRLLILRMVDPRDRGFATSIFGFFGTVMALPSPNLFGRVIDGMCIVKNGNDCALYDRDKIRYLMSGIDVGVAVCIQITQFFIVWLFRIEERDTKRKLEEEKAQKDAEAHEMSVKQ